MYCIDTEALVFMFNGGSSYGFTIHPIFTRICRLYTNHLNNEKHMHHGFLAPQPHLCSTSFKRKVLLDLLTWKNGNALWAVYVYSVAAYINYMYSSDVNRTKWWEYLNVIARLHFSHQNTKYANGRWVYFLSINFHNL